VICASAQAYIYANQPEDIDYGDYGISNALIVDNTGIFKDEEALSRHLRPGASRVLLTAPAGGKIKNIVYGVNHEDIKDSDAIVCAASCTTNAITPVLKAINDKFGIANGHVETVHSYTNDQNLIDNYHSAERMAVCNLNLNEATDRDALNAYMRDVAFTGELKQQIDYSSSTEVVSSDFVGTPEPAIFDSVATIVDGNRCVLYVWYDNEYGYTTQVLRVLQLMAGLQCSCSVLVLSARAQCSVLSAWCLVLGAWCLVLRL